LLARNTSGGQRLSQKATSGSDEWSACEILLVAGLLTYEHYRGGRRTFTKDGLCGVLPKGAGPTTRRGISQCFN
jgi:hypothetical protein